MLHFAAHSHHLWPDVTREAQLKCWDDAAELADEKWERVFGEVVPEAQRNVAALIGASAPQNVCFAPNVHEFLARLLSCFPAEKPLRILASDSEFHSAARQFARLEERPSVSIERVAVEPFSSFSERFAQAAAGSFDFVYLSHVFYNSGYLIDDLAGLVGKINSDAVVAVDGYHAAGAVPVDISDIEARIFYLGGGYKYLQSGEGAAYMWMPPGCRLRPEDTGWFAAFSELEEPDDGGKLKVAYPADGFRFWGATFDPSGLYRFNAVQRWLRELGLDARALHSYVQRLQRGFIDRLRAASHPLLSEKSLLFDSWQRQGHFLTFELTEAAQLHRALRQKDVITDVRGNRLRIGFGLYQSEENLDEFFTRLREI